MRTRRPRAGRSLQRSDQLICKGVEARTLRRFHEHDVLRAQFITQEIVCLRTGVDEYRLTVPGTFEPRSVVNMPGPVSDHDQFLDVQSHDESTDSIVGCPRILWVDGIKRQLAEHCYRAPVAG